MKKILLSILIVLFMQNIGFASPNQYLYVVKNVTPEKLTNDIQTIFDKKYSKIDKINNIILLNDGDFYYFKIYKADNNSEVYIYTTDENISSLIQQLPQKAYPLYDKSSIIQYNNEFITYARKYNIYNSKIKETKPNLIYGKYKKYKPYNGRLINTVIERTYTEENNIKIECKKMLPKTKLRRHVNAYEYIIYNNTNSDITIKKVASADFIGRRQITLLCLIPGKELIPIYGLYYKINTTIEKKHFTNPHPQNEIIKNGDKMRILAIAKKKIKPAVDFYFNINNKDIIIKVN